MDLVKEALRAPAAASPHRTPHGPTALVVGGGGPLGSAVLEQLLARGRFSHVRVLVHQTFSGSVRGLEPVTFTSFDDTAEPARALAQVAVVVIDRERHANGREDAFVRAAPGTLATLSRWLWRQGVRDLVIVLPHSPASLPQALKLGLANLDEQAVTSLGFGHVVFVRSAQQMGPRPASRDPQGHGATGHGAGVAGWLHAVAEGLLSSFSG